MAPDAARRFPANALLAIGFRRENDLARHDAVVEDPLLVVKIVDEQVQRVNALLKPLLQPEPLSRRDNAWHDVEREDLLHSSLLAIHIERDPHLHQHPLGGRLSPRKLPRRKRFNALHEVSRARAGHLGLRQELVIEAPYLVVGKVHEYNMTIGVRQRRTAVDVRPLAESVPAVVMLAFTLELCARSPVNLHANGTNRMIAPLRK